MAKFSFAFVICLAVVVPFSCADIGSPPPGEPSSLIPLTIGNFWNYADSIFYGTDSVVVHNYSWSVVGTKNIYWGGESLQVYLLHWADNTRYWDWFYRNTPDGLIRYDGPPDSTGQPTHQTLLLKYPLQVGDTWKVDQGDYFHLLRCISTDTLIATPWRSFHCYQIRLGLPTDTIYWDSFYCDKFGMVAAFARTLGRASSVKTALLGFRVL